MPEDGVSPNFEKKELIASAKISEQKRKILFGVD